MSDIDDLVKSLSKHSKDLSRQHQNNEKDTNPRKFTYNPVTGKRINTTSTRYRSTKRTATVQTAISKK